LAEWNPIRGLAFSDMPPVYRDPVVLLLAATAAAATFFMVVVSM